MAAPAARLGVLGGPGAFREALPGGGSIHLSRFVPRRAAGMNDPAPILDYASPRQRVSVRFPSRSVLRRDRGGGRYAITETLAGKPEALGALAFAGVVLAWMIVVGASQWALSPRPLLAFFGAFWLLLAGVGVQVIRNTWRTTVLRVDGAEVTVVTSGPLSSRRHYECPMLSASQIAVITSDADGTLGELRIYPAVGPDLHLFTDHALRELTAILGEINAVLVPAGSGADAP